MTHTVLLSAIPQPTREELKTNKLSCRCSCAFFLFQIIIVLNIALKPHNHVLSLTQCGAPQYPSALSFFLNPFSRCSIINLRFGLKSSGFVALSLVCLDDSPWSRGADFVLDWACSDSQPKRASPAQQSRDEQPAAIRDTGLFFF